MHFDPNDRQSLTARVYEHIREDIIEGRYANGAYLVETKLAEELDVSRTPIREALKQLELEDLVATASELTDTMAADPIAHVVQGYHRFRRYAPRFGRCRQGR